jgi:imidazolonepropionase-like amidohydrolase
MQRLRTSLSGLVLMLSATCLTAQTPRDTVPTVVRAGRLFDSERGVMTGPQEILVVDGRVSEVATKVSRPKGVRIVDLSKYTVLPGLIDAHTHLLYLENPKAGLSSEAVKAVTMEGTPLRALHGAARGWTYLAAGITTVRDLGNSGRFGDIALRTAIRDGSVDGPNLVASGPGLSPPGGQFPGVLPEFQSIIDVEYRIVRGPVDAALAVQENVASGAQVIKIYSNNTPNPGALSTAEIEAVVAAAKLLDVPVAAHATDDAAVWRAAAAGVNSVEHGYEIADSTLRLMAERGVYLVPTDFDSLSAVAYSVVSGQGPQLSPGFLAYLHAGRDRLQRALKAGVPIAAGSDNYIEMGMPQGVASRRVLFAYIEAGMSPVQVLQAATVNAGRLLRYDDLIGVLKPNAYADIIAVEGNPLDDFSAMERVVWVMKRGTIYKSP